MGYVPMKHLFILLFAIIFISSFAFTQSNDATIEQVGLNNDADVTQTGTHEAMISQTGDDNISTAIQLGSATKSFVTQIQTGDENSATALYLGQSGDWSGGSTGVIEQIQTGNNNTAYAVGRESADLRQKQIGNNNDAQIGDPTGESGSPNGIRRVMGVDQYQEGSFNTAFVEPFFRFIRDGNINQSQVGDDNLAEALGLTNAANINQSQIGDHNTSIVEQGGSNFEANTTQEGDWNEAYITTGGHSFNEIIQIGNHNLGTIQTSSSSSGTISQTGNYNVGTITQSNSN